MGRYLFVESKDVDFHEPIKAGNRAIVHDGISGIVQIVDKHGNPEEMIVENSVLRISRVNKDVTNEHDSDGNVGEDEHPGDEDESEDALSLKTTLLVDVPE